MKYLRAFRDSLYLSWIGLVGGTVQGKYLYILWTIHCYGLFRDIEFSDNTLHPVRDVKYIFDVHEIKRIKDTVKAIKIKFGSNKCT